MFFIAIHSGACGLSIPIVLRREDIFCKTGGGKIEVFRVSFAAADVIGLLEPGCVSQTSREPNHCCGKQPQHCLVYVWAKARSELLSFMYGLKPVPFNIAWVMYGLKPVPFNRDGDFAKAHR
jgi:hypothetical protein